MLPNSFIFMHYIVFSFFFLCLKISGCNMYPPQFQPNSSSFTALKILETKLTIIIQKKIKSQERDKEFIVLHAINRKHRFTSSKISALVIAIYLVSSPSALEGCNNKTQLYISFSGLEKIVKPFC